ncbi:MAG: ECF transporter S component [Clostridioides sp.]|jgi:uncharacterized membrane protein|nr:ECF transporter S component [Clostridioides sp.]
MGNNADTVKKNTSKSMTSSVVQVGIMAAIAFVCTSIINIPFFSGEGVLHLGDSAVFIAAIMLGKKKGALAGAIGMTLFDVLSPYVVWAPFTFVIKGLMGYTAGVIAYRNGYEGKNLWNNVLAFIVAGVVMMIGYFFAGWMIYDWPNAVLGVPSNALQVLLGMAVALPITNQLKKHIKL